jgi:membrane-associated phospholipid phosphatase
MKPDTHRIGAEPPAAHRPDGPLLAWPAPRDLRFGLLLCLAFFVFFELTYIATNYLTGLHHFRVHVHSRAELSIPFVPAMALVYVSLNLMLALTPFILRTWDQITPLAIVLTLETLICAVFFLLLPVEPGYAAQAAPGALGRFCAWVSALSLTYNYLPSLHVAFAFSAAMAFGRRCGALGHGLFLIWAGLIAASTVLTHQHHLADVAAGIALAVAMHRVYLWWTVPSRLEALRLELLCLVEFRHFVLRHRRYLFTLIVIYRYSLGRWRRTRIVRAGYCLTQHVDDVLDGDRRVGRDPEAYVRELLRQIADDDYEERAGTTGVMPRRMPTNEDAPQALSRGPGIPLASSVSVLARYVVTTLRSDCNGSGADQDLIRLFDLLLFDHRRLKERLLLSGEELREHHYRTFYYSLNLTLIACGAELRATDAGELISALAWCSVMRDLEEDLAKGLINIPAAVLEQAEKQGAAVTDYGQLVRTAAVRTWIRAEYMRGLAAMEQCDSRVELLRSREGVRILALFLRAIRLYARKYARVNREILGTDTMAALEEVRGDGPC